jgi:hypothetical protein
LDVVLGQERGTRLVRILPMLFQSGDKQFVFERHAAEDFAVDPISIVIAAGLGQDFTDLQSAPRPHNHPAAPRISNRIGRGEAANLAQDADANEVVGHVQVQ